MDIFDFYNEIEKRVRPLGWRLDELYCSTPKWAEAGFCSLDSTRSFSVELVPKESLEDFYVKVKDSIDFYNNSW